MAQKRLCAICGVNEASTLDHLPPRAIFPKPRPGNLITVPACFGCNHGSAKEDEQFRVYLSMQTGTDDPQSKKLWKQHSLSTLRKNRKLHRAVLQGMRPVELRSEAGIYLGKRTAFKFPAHVYEKVMERTARGLYYHHYNDILGSRVRCEVAFLRSLDEDFFKASAQWPQIDIGNGAVIYRYSRAAESLLSSVWVFQFYGAHWALVETEPVPALNPARQTDGREAAHFDQPSPAPAVGREH